MLTRIETESARLNALIEELMTLHRLDSSNPSLQRERVDLIELLHAIAEDAEFEALTKGVSVHIDAPGRFVADVHGELIYRAFENVIRNALKFAPSGSTIDIAAHADKGALQVTVADRGCGVPDDMLEAIFMPFVRSEVQSTTQRGTGLGLAITRRAIQMHGGAVKAMSRDGGGLAIGFSLPAS